MKNIISTLGLAALVALSSGCRDNAPLTKLEIYNPQIVSITQGEARIQGQKHGTNYLFVCESSHG